MLTHTLGASRNHVVSKGEGWGQLKGHEWLRDLPKAKTEAQNQRPN